MGFATHVRSHVSMIQPPSASAIRNDESYGSTVSRSPLPPCP